MRMLPYRQRTHIPAARVGARVVVMPNASPQTQATPRSGQI